MNLLKHIQHGEKVCITNPKGRKNELYRNQISQVRHKKYKKQNKTGSENPTSKF